MEQFGVSSDVDEGRPPQERVQVGVSNLAVVEREPDRVAGDDLDRDNVVELRVHQQPP
jgi:hypothetical protein